MPQINLSKANSTEIANACRHKTASQRCKSGHAMRARQKVQRLNLQQLAHSKEWRLNMQPDKGFVMFRDGADLEWQFSV